MQTVNTIVFDLDGTLLDTLEDLTISVNHALSLYGLPQRSSQDIRRSMGNGIRQLVRLSVPGNLPENLFEEVFQCFRDYYVAHSLVHTRPYPGVMDMLDKLKAEGIKMAIVSNKVHEAVLELNCHFFGKHIDIAVGESATVKRKPHPDTLLKALERLDNRPEDSLYVGDSEVDVETARNAGVPCVAVLWGFRDERTLRTAGAQTFIAEPLRLLEIVRR